MSLWLNTTITGMTDQIYTHQYGSFRIEPTRFMFKSVDAESGKDLLFGATADAVYQMTPTHQMAHKLGLKEGKTYSGEVLGKL